MEGRKLTGFAIIAAIFLIVFIAVSMLCSCTTKQKVVTEFVTVHDTIHSHHTDTLRDVKEFHHSDTVYKMTERLVTLNSEGLPIKEVNNHYYYEKETVRDSTSYYKAERDSLRAAQNKAEGKTKVVVKTRNVFPWYNWLVILAIMAILVYMAKRLYRSL